jgi:hypothetical protein
VKKKALGQLKHSIILAEEGISEHFESIARNLIRLYGREENRLNEDIKNVSEVLGVYVDANLYVPIILKLLFDEETKVSPKLSANTLVPYYLTLLYSGSFCLPDQERNPGFYSV